MEEKWAKVNQAGGSTVPTCYPPWDQPCKAPTPSSSCILWGTPNCLIPQGLPLMLQGTDRPGSEIGKKGGREGGKRLEGPSCPLRFLNPSSGALFCPVLSPNKAPWLLWAPPPCASNLEGPGVLPPECQSGPCSTWTQLLHRRPPGAPQGSQPSQLIILVLPRSPQCSLALPSIPSPASVSCLTLASSVVSLSLMSLRRVQFIHSEREGVRVTG